MKDYTIIVIVDMLTAVARTSRDYGKEKNITNKAIAETKPEEKGGGGT